MKKIIVMLLVLVANYAHAAQFKLNCGGFGNDPHNRSFVITATDKNVRIKFATSEKTLSGAIDSDRTNKAVTVYSLNLFNDNGSVGIPTNLNHSSISVRYYSGTNFSAWYTATCTKL